MNLSHLSKKLSLLSKNSNHHSHRMAAVVLNKKIPISWSWNEIKTHPRSPTPWKMCHAEINALINLDYEISKGCTIIVYRENRNGELAEAKPCSYCEKMIKDKGIKKVYYTSDNSWKEYYV